MTEQTAEEKLRNLILEAWWKVDTKSAPSKALMLTPVDHRNLLGDKFKYLNPILEAVKQAGYKSPEEVLEAKNKLTFELGEIARKVISENYVKLTEDQPSPLIKEV